MNFVIISGNATKESEIRFTQSGKAVASFTLAINREYKKDGETKQLTDFIPVVAWGKLAEDCEDIKKGTYLSVQGRLQVRSYTAKDNSKRYVTEVIASFIGKALKSEEEKKSEFDKYGKDVPEEEIPF